MTTRAADQARVLAEQAMDAGHTDIEQPVDRVAHHFGGDARLLGHRQIGGARRGDENRSAARLYVCLAIGNGASDG